ncbi:uncharacterized protein LOC122254131 [Penaeus japonicus]|uniref:uncharacterized protein LOC122254131 n=1 Tax=Penaeus japonicus TaxID=27405 RepID=UPI001C70E8C0|nr:uncharacterized protein LOC122254131 [Penaeus japonicus]
MRSIVLLAALLAVALASPADPKVKKLLAASEDEAAAALLEEPRDKRDWVHFNKDGIIDAVVESDVNPAVVAGAIASASNPFGDSFPSSSAVSGRTRPHPYNWGNYGHSYPYSQHFNTQGRTRGSGFSGQGPFNNQHNWMMWRNFMANDQGFSPYPFNQFSQGHRGPNFGQNLPDVIDTSPEGRTRMATDASGNPYTIVSAYDRNFQNFNPNFHF